MKATAAHPNDPRWAPNYRIPEAAHCMGISAATISYWCFGGRRRGRPMNPVLRAADFKGRRLSFFNLVEIHGLRDLRRDKKISLQHIRRALDYVRKTVPGEHHLASHDFLTDGTDLFVEQLGHLVNISQDGQLALKAILRAYLKRIDYGSDRMAVRFFPFIRLVRTKEDAERQPKNIVIDPRVSFGRPVLAGTGIAVEVLAQRYQGGESVAEIARDCGVDAEKIDDAIRFELPKAA